MNAIILHGIEKDRKTYLELPESDSNLGWYPVAQWELTKRGILTQTPEMPNPYLPDLNYDEWVKTISQFDISHDTILIGHSCGGGFWLKYLSLNPQIKVKRLILVAPWIDIDREHPAFFADWKIDANLSARCGRIDLFVSSDDMDIILKSVDKIKSVYGDKIEYHEFNDKGHFSWGCIGRTFPELLEII
ncbi:MAG: alpha/beta hydrolase [Rickettsiales bacterium]|jgi:predicted alpha/beta hydrolase family esterase|nr:alpha/beta hydrolase [Rickettsiales bacterium]